MENTEEGRPTPEPEPKIIGLTGGIGSGKTTVAESIRDLGYPVYYSDDRAKQIVNEDDFLKTEIKQLLGPEAYDESGAYNRKFVSSVVFENDELLQKLNALIHPAVKRDFENWVSQQNTALVFKETALLFELGLEKDCYKSLLVTAEDNVRIKRVMDRDDKTYREVQNIMQKQMAEKDKIRLADYVIYNNNGVDELQEETEKTVVLIEEAE